MRSFILAGACLFAVASAAQAGSVQGGFVAGQATGNQGSAFSSTNTTNGSGNGTGSSASGTVFSLGANNGSHVQYTSNGSAYSKVTTSPFGVTTNSSHEAFSSGSASNGASFTASNQTFGQSSGNSAFTSQNTTTKSNYANSAFKIVGAEGFLSFEGGNR